MYGPDVRMAALELLRTGISLNAASKQLGISRAALREWTVRVEPLGRQAGGLPRLDQLDAWAYAHLLGLYLGDGYINATHRKGVHLLRITCDDRYPRVIAEATLSIHRVRPEARIFLAPQVGCTSVGAYWKHCPLVFPQHGAGRKHEREIVLADWQRRMVEQEPGRFLRGLFHSDGCRVTNWTVKLVAGEPKRYEYPRYFFTNVSDDIRRLCVWALDLLGVSWRATNAYSISVARSDAVAALDRCVGPKT
jgi:hypothetical protein